MIYIGADHRGYELKEEIKKFLYELDYEYEDMGAFEYNKDDDYPDFARVVAEKVAESEENRGIIICGSGIGIAVAANKISGVRAGTAYNPDQIQAAVNDEHLNILALSSDFTSEEVAKEIIQAFLSTEYGDAERYYRRLGKIKELER